MSSMCFYGLEEMVGPQRGFSGGGSEVMEKRPGKSLPTNGEVYRAAHRALAPGSLHVTNRYANSWAERSHEATRFRE